MTKGRRMGRRRPRGTYLLRLAWRAGGTTERLLVAYIASSAMLTILAVAIVTIISGVNPREAIWFWFVSFGGIVAFPGFQGPIYDSAYGLGFLRATLSQDWMRQSDREYYQELLRFRSTRGTTGRLSDDLAWASAYCVLYPCNVLVGVLLVLVFYPETGSPAGVVMTIVEWIAGIAAGGGYSARNKRNFPRGGGEGFRVLGTQPATRRPSAASGAARGKE